MVAFNGDKVDSGYHGYTFLFLRLRIIEKWRFGDVKNRHRCFRDDLQPNDFFRTR